MSTCKNYSNQGKGRQNWYDYEQDNYPRELGVSAPPDSLQKKYIS